MKSTQNLLLTTNFLIAAYNHFSCLLMYIYNLYICLLILLFQFHSINFLISFPLCFFLAKDLHAHCKWFAENWNFYWKQRLRCAPFFLQILIWESIILSESMALNDVFIDENKQNILNEIDIFYEQCSIEFQLIECANRLNAMNLFFFLSAKINQFEYTMWKEINVDLPHTDEMDSSF